MAVNWQNTGHETTATAVLGLCDPNHSENAEHDLASTRHLARASAFNRRQTRTSHLGLADVCNTPCPLRILGRVVVAVDPATKIDEVLGIIMASVETGVRLSLG